VIDKGSYFTERTTVGIRKYFKLNIFRPTRQLEAQTLEVEKMWKFYIPSCLLVNLSVLLFMPGLFAQNAILNRIETTGLNFWKLSLILSGKHCLLHAHSLTSTPFQWVQIGTIFN